MSIQAPNWFNEKFKSQVLLSLQPFGGMLDNTMLAGETEAGTVKFPFMSGRTTMYKLSGAIQPVPVVSKGLSTVSLQPDDFEAIETWRTQDAYKSTPSEQAALVKTMASAVRRKRDTMKLDTLAAYKVAQAAAVTTIGTGVEVPDMIHFETGRAQIEALGDYSAEGDIFCAIPAMYMLQLSMYKEYANSQWVGPENTVFSKAQRAKFRTVHGIHYIVLPDEYFASPSGQPTQLITWMWHKEALGCELPINMENADLFQRKDLEGAPWQARVALSGAAIGLRPELVKQFVLQKIAAPIRPA